MLRGRGNRGRGRGRGRGRTAKATPATPERTGPSVREQRRNRAAEDRKGLLGGKGQQKRSRFGMDDDEKPKKEKVVHEAPANVKELLKWSKEEGSGCVVDSTAFATLFPRYLEPYLRNNWENVCLTLKPHGIVAELNASEGSMTVRTTRNVWDPYMIVKARDMIKLLSRSVPLGQAAKVLDDNVAYDIIKIGGIVSNKEVFLKRRNRLIGPDGKTLKALELLTNCYVLVQGNTVTCMGTHIGCQSVREVVLDTMNNIHPIYGIKRLLVRRELANNPDLANEDWSKFLPQYKKKANPASAPKRTKKQRKIAERKKSKEENYSPFPPQNHFPQRKEDQELATGEAQFTAEKFDHRKWREQKKQREAKQSTNDDSLDAAGAADSDSDGETRKRKRDEDDDGIEDDIRETLTKKHHERVDRRNWSVKTGQRYKSTVGKKRRGLQ